MDAESFCFWLQGLFEIQDPETLDNKQLTVIRERLGKVLGDEESTKSDPKKARAEALERLKRGRRSVRSTVKTGNTRNTCRSHRRIC